MSLRLLSQILVIGALSGVLGFASNTLRQGLPWGGSSSEEIIYRDVTWIDATEAAPLQSDVTALFLDARPVAAFERHRIHGAVSFPADAVEAAYGELRDFLDPSMVLVVYADDPNLVVRVAKFLDARGFTARCLLGGIDAWERERLPTDAGAR